MGERYVHVVDDEEAVRRSLSFMLKTTGHTVSVWNDGPSFLHVARSQPLGCILLDVRMPQMDGMEVQRALVDAGVSMPVIVLTGHGDIGTAVTAMRQGATDFLEKPFEKAALLRALELGFDRLERGKVTEASAIEAKARLNALTPREQDVLAGLTRGHPNKTIAYDLGISPRTVEVHRANVMAKLGVASLSEVLRLAYAAEALENS